MGAGALVLSSVPSRAQDAQEHLGGCSFAADVQWCEISRKQFADEFPQALRGDYQAQRNVAYCLSTGCDGAVQVSAPHGCAWRIVIQASGSSKVDAADKMAFSTWCGKLDAIDRATAIEQAKGLFRKIYGRKLPARFQ